MAARGGASSVFEAKKVDLWVDDSLPLAASIYENEVDKSVVLYKIRVTRAITEEMWEVVHRYSEFDELHAALESLGELPCPLPPKKVFGNLDRQFIMERQKALQAYLDQLLAFPPAQFSHALRAFLDPTNYQRTFMDEALLGLSMFLRSEPTWQIVEPLPLIGSRMRKAYLLVNNRMDSADSAHVRKTLTWNPLGKPLLASQDVISSALKYISGIEHPFIMPAMVGTVLEGEATAAILVREFCAKGSLKDLIMRNKNPRAAYFRKYPPPGRGRPLDPRQLQLYGRQILEALKFLHDKSIPYGHLHSGNVIIVSDSVCRITDVENGILSCPARTKPIITQLRALKTVQQIDVYCFGLVLFEMATGAELPTPTCENVNPNVPAAAILQKLITTEGVRNLPSVPELLSESFFLSAGVPPTKGTFKASGRVKEALAQMCTNLDHFTQRQQTIMDDAKRATQEARRATKEVSQAQQRKAKRSASIEVSGNVDFSRLSSSSLTTPTPPSTTSPNTSGPPPGGAAAAGAAVAASAPPPPRAPPSSSSSSSSSRPPASSAAPPPPPPPPAPAAPRAPPPPSAPAPSSGGAGQERGALLNSIRGFGGGLRKTVTNDRSGPTI